MNEIEKAIDDLDDLKNCESISSSHFKEVHGKNLELAISALEKQIPKKPIEYNKTNRADCPVCWVTVRGIGKPYGSHCSGCGQKLNWLEDTK